jgi:small subunit ribosomal protein S5
MTEEITQTGGATNTGPQGAVQSGHARAGGQERNERRPRRERAPRARSEFDNKVIDIRRVTRVVAGGRRFSFSVTIVLGNGHGKVGVGLGKASDTALAIEKATRDAQRNMVTVPITEGGSIPHDVSVKYASSQVLLIPAPGKGLKAGSAVRTVLELAGVRNVSGKILSRSKNPLNNARATMCALRALVPKKKRRSAEKGKQAVGESVPSATEQTATA